MFGFAPQYIPQKRILTQKKNMNLFEVDLISFSFIAVDFRHFTLQPIANFFWCFNIPLPTVVASAQPVIIFCKVNQFQPD